MLGVIDSVAPFITVNEQSESNPDCDVYSSIASLHPRNDITRIYKPILPEVYTGIGDIKCRIQKKVIIITMKLINFTVSLANKAEPNHRTLVIFPYRDLLARK